MGSEFEIYDEQTASMKTQATIKRAFIMGAIGILILYLIIKQWASI